MKWGGIVELGGWVKWGGIVELEVGEERRLDGVRRLGKWGGWVEWGVWVKWGGWVELSGEIGWSWEVG